MKVLFLCSSNIFRSQVAEAFFNKYSEHKAESAALIKPQDKMHSLVVRAMKEKGIDISQNKSKATTIKMVDEADLIILMDSSLEFYLPIKKDMEIWDIQDVIARENEESKYKEFVEVRDKIEKKVKELIDKIG